MPKFEEKNVDFQGVNFKNIDILNIGKSPIWKKIQ